MYDYNLGIVEDSDYKNELFDEFDFDWEDFEIDREKEEVFNLMTLRESIEILERISQENSNMEKFAIKTINSLNKFIKEYDK